MNCASSTIINYFIINNGKITISTLRGKRHDVYITSDYKYIYSPTGLKHQRINISLFDDVFEFIKQNGGTVKKGNCRNSKVGEDKCTKGTLTYFVAKNYYNCNDGDSSFDPIFIIAAIFDNVGICNNKRGYIELNYKL